jgi:hypothetical protein
MATVCWKTRPSNNVTNRLSIKKLVEHELCTLCVPLVEHELCTLCVPLVEHELCTLYVPLVEHELCTLCVPLVEHELCTLHDHRSSPSGFNEVPLVEHELCTLHDHMSSPSGFNEVPLVEHELCTLHDHLSSPSGFNEVHDWCRLLYVCAVRLYLQWFVEGSRLIYFICVCLRIVVFNTYCVLFLFCFSSSCVPYVYSSHRCALFVYLFLPLWHCLSFCPFSFGHCVVCPSIYGFWLPLWILQTLLIENLINKR